MDEKNSEKRTIGIKEIVIYGGGGMFTYSFQLLITNYYILFFMTDVLKINALLAATLNSVIQWIEVGTMPLGGILIDSSSIKKDKYGTWTLIAGIVMGISLPLTYLVLGLPTGIAAILMMIWYFIMAFAYNVGWTALRALTGVIGKNSADVVTLAASSSVFSSIPGVFWASISTFLFSIPLWADTPNRFAGASLVIGIVIIIGAFLVKGMTSKCDAVIAEEKKEKSGEKVSFIDMIKNIKGSMVAYLLSMAFAAAQGGIFSTLLIYYSTYVIGDASVTAKAISWSSVGSFIGSILVPIIVPKVGQKRSQWISQCILCGLYLAMYLFTKNAFAFIALRFLQNVFASFYIILLASMATDIGDYNEMNGTPQAPAFLQSIGGTGIRIGWALATALASYVLVLVGYEQGIEVTAKMAQGFANGIILGPAVCAALAAFFMIWYKIDEKALSEYRKEKVSKYEVAD